MRKILLILSLIFLTSIQTQASIKVSPTIIELDQT